MPHDLRDEPVGVAPTERRTDWREPFPAEPSPRERSPDGDRVPASLRPIVARAWTHVAQRAHASIADYALLSMRLLRLGAPPDLVERSNLVMRDTTWTARAAFALASAYGGRPIGPGCLPPGAELGEDLGNVVAFVVREGCVAGTLGAVEANEAEGTCVDPAVRAVLARIAIARGEQAELGWRTVRWALASPDPAARDRVEDELAALDADVEETPPPTTTASDASLLAWGVASEALRAGIRVSALERIVLPQLREALRRAGRRAA